MDFTVFDNRGPAEVGQRLALLDPTVRQGTALRNPDGTECAVIVRGSTARSVQLAARARQKSAAAASRQAATSKVMEDVHEDLCAAAAPLIVGFEHIEREGRPLTADPADVAWFLGLTFPVMAVRENDEGEPELTPEGGVQFVMRNNPFAKQIGEFSAAQAARLGNGEGG